MTFVRSLTFQICFYLVTVVMLLVTLPVFFFLPQEPAMNVVRTWSRVMLWLLHHIAGTKVEWRGLEHLDGAPAIIAPKHQSMFETVALIPFLKNPAIVMKEQLKDIPVFGAYTVKTGQIHVDRAGGAKALRMLSERARAAIADQRDVLLFPEGTRRAPGAKPDYQPGIALLYRQLDAPVVPVALNSGVFWPRRSFLRHPGTITVEFLPRIEPGLDGRTFLADLQERIETASNRLLEDAGGTPAA